MTKEVPASSVPAGKKVRTIAGIKVALTPGRTYSVSMPGNYVGPVQIFLLDVRKDKTPVRGKTVLSTDSIPVEKRKAFFDEFPAALPW